MKLLDLFCGAGESSVGYYGAGFDDIVGVDMCRGQRKVYPFEFVCGNPRYLSSLQIEVESFDLIHVNLSTRVLNCTDMSGLFTIQAQLETVGCPYVIEYSRSPGRLKDRTMGQTIALKHSVEIGIDCVLCGTMFGLPVLCHRWFQIGGLRRQLILTPPCDHDRRRFEGCFVNDELMKRDFAFGLLTKYQISQTLGIDWMSREEMLYATPPVYTQFLGNFLGKFLCHNVGSC